MQLSSLKIIVTGAAQGMGAHFARRLAEAGASVAAGDVKEDGLAALAANTVTWEREFASFGIRVCGVAPGMVETPMTQGMNQKARDAAVAAIPVGRIGTPEDLWLAVKFCLECDYFNGRTIDVDGGLSM